MKNTSAFNDRQEVEAKQFKILKIVLLQLLVYLLLFFLLLLLFSIPLLTPEEDQRSKLLTFFIFFVSSCRWVHFSGAVLFCQPHQQLFTHFNGIVCQQTVQSPNSNFHCC